MKTRSHRRSAISVLLAVLVFLGSVMMPAMQTEAHAYVTQAQIDQKAAEKAALQKKITAQKEKMNQLKEQEADMLTRKTALDEQQIMKVEEINLVKEELQLYRDMIVQKEEEARIAQENADIQLENYKLHLRSMEEQGLENMYLSLLFSSKDFSELITRIDMVGEIMEYDTRVRDEYLAAKAVALQAKQEYEEAVALLEVKEVELQEQIDILTGQLDELQADLEELQSDINGYASVIASYQASEKAISDEIKRLSQELKEQESPPTATGSYTWPTPSCKVVSSKYGWRNIAYYGYARFHAGVDIGAGSGSPIVAADGGVVITSTSNGGGYGSYIVINHGDGRQTLYAHMSARVALVGDTVTKGQVIGYVGSTGNSTGPHLHFEVYINGSTVNPLQYFSGYTVAG